MNFIEFKNQLREFYVLDKILENSNSFEEIIEALPKQIRSMGVVSRVKLIDIINQNKCLGNVEDYLADFLYIPENKDLLKTTIYKGMGMVVSSLAKTKGLEKMKLLQEIRNNISSIIKESFNYFNYGMELLLNEILKLEKKFPKSSKEAQTIINQINGVISDNFEGILKYQGYQINLINLFRKFNIDNSRFKNVQDDIINNLSEGELVKYIQSTKGNEGFDKNWDFSELTRQLFKYNEQIMYDEVAQRMISKLIEELCEHENVGIQDIEYGGSGYFNFNIRIGSYILKLGNDQRKVEEIPNHKRIIKPLLRQMYNLEDVEGIAYISVEIQNIVDADWYKKLSKKQAKEELYKIYSELRDDGIIWTDIRAQNVGRLLKPNKENFIIELLNENGKIEKVELKSDNYAIGYTGKEPKEILQPGELVIIDTDYIYKENNEMDIIYGDYYGDNYGDYKEFEERYEREHGKKEKIVTPEEIEENESYSSKEVLGIKSIKEILKQEGYTLEELDGTLEELLDFELQEDNKYNGGSIGKE